MSEIPPLPGSAADDRLALPPVEELLASAVAVELPMRTRFRGQIVREAMLLRGPSGWAEFAPFAEYEPPETAAWLAAAVEAGWCGLGVVGRRRIPINATMPAVGPERVEAVLRGFGDLDRIPAVKVKVAEPGESLDDDVARLAEVRRLVPRAMLRADANGAWTHEQALAGAEALADVAGDRLEYLEQPVAGIEPLAELREALHHRGASVPIAADEAVRKAEDPLRAARLGAADLIVVKVAPLGGVERALAVVAAAGLEAVVSSALDTSIGLTAGLALASRLETERACGLGTAALLASDVVADPLIPADGGLYVPHDAGGEAHEGEAAPALVRAPAPDERLLAAHRLDAAGQARWRRRLQAAHASLAGG
ncbi:o-succinylbenzoate synthase [Nesterenkonia sp. F]|uniref:o-succinylbenzoate synthase n=1 Tax=Nesterenkonia sp. F TaxID=795955 RepID=UPI000255D257|nr:o-succinylbenzoate synthase [Nesterenkonia sp. F]